MADGGGEVPAVVTANGDEKKPLALLAPAAALSVEAGGTSAENDAEEAVDLQPAEAPLAAGARSL